MASNIIYSKEPEDYYYMGVNVPCQSACPALTNIPAYIRALYEEHYDQSYIINRLANILPGVLGRICSRPCEDKCRHGESELGQPVNICHIKRSAGDLMADDAPFVNPTLPSLGKKVALIGSGPAGLAAAHDLSTVGFHVTIYEALEKPGGMLRYGIPEFRLPRQVIDAEINHILGFGIDLKTGIRVGDDVSMETLLADYDAVLVATGCYDSNRLDVPGESLSGVYYGLEFMMDVCSARAPVLGNRVLVLGAGFTAFDCVRSALRLGAKDVTLCLRRTEEDLVVTKDEIHEAKVEGVQIKSLMVSTRILGNGKVEGVEFVRTRAGNVRQTGKREVTSIAGSDFRMPADAVIVATGQRPQQFDTPGEKNDHGLLVTDRETFRTSIPGLYVAGDYVTGPSTVIEAIAMGRKAAEGIAEDLTGRTFREKVVRLQETKITDRQRAWDYVPRQEMPTVTPVEDRFTAMTREVESGYSHEQARTESKRCYLCYLHYEIDLNRCIYCRYCIDVAPRDCIKLVDEVMTNEAGAITGFVETTRWKDVNAIVIDNSRCIRCGECMRVCPVDCISVTRVELVERMHKGED
ncbi:FAD-dependent oxidoreductase [bacterium]|nr:FAD-dependent oxidoreductase [bacterium]